MNVESKIAKSLPVICCKPGWYLKVMDHDVADC